MVKRRRMPVTPRPRVPVESSGGLQTRFELLTYAFSRLPPRQLPLLAAYAYTILYACNHGWISREATGKAGAAVVTVLSMVTGLLLSYRFSSSVSKWDEGKKVWAEVRTTIRDGVRALSVQPKSIQNDLARTDSESSPVDLGEAPFGVQVEADTSLNTDQDPFTVPVARKKSKSLGSSSTTTESSPSKVKAKGGDVVAERTDELTGLIVGFAYALQHHLHGSRPLPQPPLCDLLPPAYLSSLKRTEARVRFAETHSTSPSDPSDTYRPGIQRRSTGPPSEQDLKSATPEEWELSILRERAEAAVDRLAEAVTGIETDGELQDQLSQLNIPITPIKSGSGSVGKVKGKSNLASPNPPNLPLAMLRLMESYVIGLAEVDVAQGGWVEAKRERLLGVVKALSAQLGDAERLRHNPPPLPLTLHLSHLLLIYLAAIPCSLLTAVSGHTVVIITVIAGWCLLGLDALVGEVGGVFGPSENHHPLPRFTSQIMNESLDISPSFLRYYRARLVARVGDGDEEVEDIDRRCRRGGEEWVPVFT